jgi:hypothetical protein
MITPGRPIFIDKVNKIIDVTALSLNMNKATFLDTTIRKPEITLHRHIVRKLVKEKIKTDLNISELTRCNFKPLNKNKYLITKVHNTFKHDVLIYSEKTINNLIETDYPKGVKVKIEGIYNTLNEYWDSL